MGDDSSIFCEQEATVDSADEIDVEMRDANDQQRRLMVRASSY
jgi:hypothetical protein